MSDIRELTEIDENPCAGIAQPPKRAKPRQPRKVPFTAASLAKVACAPEHRDVHVYDAKTPGLAYRVTRNGVAAFYFIRWSNGRPVRLKIGGAEIGIHKARKQAARLNGEAALGIDPAEARRKKRAAKATLDTLLTRFIETHAKPHKRSAADDEAQIKRYLADWKAKPLGSIKQEDVRALHAKIGRDNGPYAANRLLALLHSAYAKAGELWDGPNPAAGIARFKEKSRDRFLTAGEIPRFFAALAAEPNETIRDFILTALMTGARKSNVLAMRWEELDLDRATWRIPDTKNGLPLLVPLAPDAVKLLADRKARSKSEWVFPSYGKTGHLVESKATWAAILKRAKISDLRVHDLRRSLGSWMAISGASLPVVGKALGHLNSATTAIYARLSLDPVRAGVDTAVAAIQAAAQRKIEPVNNLSTNSSTGDSH